MKHNKIVGYTIIPSRTVLTLNSSEHSSTGQLLYVDKVVDLRLLTESTDFRQGNFCFHETNANLQPFFIKLFLSFVQ